MLTALEKAREIQKQKKESGEKIERLNYKEKHLKNPKSQKWAIAAKCFDCVCEQRNEIALCQIVNCSLYNFRPIKNG